MSDFLGLHPIGLPGSGAGAGVSLGGLTAGQVAALVGSSGNPSGSNPFVTSTDARLAPQVIPPSPGTYLYSGASVTWVTGFQFLLGAAVYYINGTQYTSAQQTVTLTAADGSNDRIDVLTLDTNGTAGKVTGTAASAPAEPAVDQSLFLGLGIVYVSANATSPGVTTTAIYTENAEWTGAASAGTIVTNSASAPRTGSVCVVGTAVAAGTTLTFTKPTTSVDLAQYGILVMYVKITAAWAATKSITCRWLAGAATVGVDVPVGDGQYGLNTQVVGAYQQVVVPLSTFAVAAGTAVTKLRLTFAGTGTVGFSMDDISIQTGTGTTGSPAQFRWRGTYSSGTAYAQNDVVVRLQSVWIALQGSTNQEPSTTSSAYWSKLGNIGMAFPDAPPVTPAAEDDEFDSTTIDAKWTLTTTGTSVRNIHTTWPSHYFASGDGTATQEVTLLQPYAPGASTAFSVTAHVRGALAVGGDETAIYATDSSGFSANYVAVLMRGSGVAVMRKKVATAASDVATQTLVRRSSSYFHLQRSAADVWQGFWSDDGFAWQRIGSVTFAFTVAKIGFDLYNNTSAQQPWRAGVNWFRVNWLTMA